MRRYDDPIDVRHRVGWGAPGAGAPADIGEPGAAPPESFVWRGRRYRVQAVLGHWHERTSWWRHALETPAGPGGDLALQEEIWRVEAAPMRGAAARPGAVGVFDLARGCRWRLIRIAD